jgi:hypothetical protein
VDYSTVEFCADHICKLLENGQAFSVAEPYVREFWVLYWGDLPIFEGSNVEEAMVSYGNKLREIRQQVQPQSGMAQLIEKANASKPTTLPTPIKFNWSQSARLGLTEQYSTLQVAALKAGVSKDELQQLENEYKKSATPAAATALRKLDAQLKSALHQDLKAKISPNAGNLKSLFGTPTPSGDAQPLSLRRGRPTWLGQRVLVEPAGKNVPKPGDQTKGVEFFMDRNGGKRVQTQRVRLLRQLDLRHLA